MQGGLKGGSLVVSTASLRHGLLGPWRGGGTGVEGGGTGVEGGGCVIGKPTVNTLIQPLSWE